MLAFVAVFVSIAGEVDFVHFDWRVEYSSSVILALTKCGFHLELRNIQINDICNTMYSAKAKCLPAFHALTGSDNTSFFSGTGKKTAYAKWSTRPELTSTLCHLMDKPETPSSDDIAVIESFIISLYSVYCTLADVNKARQQIFAQSSRTFEYLPPMKAALVEHIKRTTHLAELCMGPIHHR